VTSPWYSKPACPTAGGKGWGGGGKVYRGDLCCSQGGGVPFGRRQCFSLNHAREIKTKTMEERERRGKRGVIEKGKGRTRVSIKRLQDICNKNRKTQKQEGGERLGGVDIQRNSKPYIPLKNKGLGDLRAKTGEGQGKMSEYATTSDRRGGN